MLRRYSIAKFTANRGKNKTFWISVGMISTGIFLAGLVVTYGGYRQFAWAQLGDLQYDTDQNENKANIYSTLYPGDLVKPIFWDNPRWTDDISPYNVKENEFLPVNNATFIPKNTLAPPKKIRIPAILLDSEIKELSILNYGDARGWETPKDIVGHIPTTANPGESGKIYLFGHLQSPIRAEGSIFRNLTRIPDLLRKGEDVYVHLENSSQKTYIYKVNKTRVIPQEDFAIEETETPTVTLVACVPAYFYDHRLIVSAELVGIKKE